MVTTRKNISEVIGVKPFHPEIELRRDLKDLVGQTFIIVDGKVVRDYHSNFGVRPCAFVLLLDEKTGEHFTTISSGVVIVNQVTEILSKRALDNYVTVSYEVSRNQEVNAEQERGYYKFS
jgi:ribosomal protein S4E